MSLVNHLNLTFGFRVGQTGKRAVVTRGLVFGIQGTGRIANLQSRMSFIISPPPATIFLYFGGDWEPSVQRVLTDDGWMPSVT